MKLTMKQTALALALTGVFGSANATVLPVNAVTSNVDIIGSYLGGTLMASAITNISNSSYSGIARTAVYKTASGLDFYYQFANSASSANGVERFTGYDFTSLTNIPVNVFQTAASFGIFTNGTEASDNADRTSSGVIAFSFIPSGHTKIEPGATSYVQIVQTHAMAYVPGNFGLLDGIGDNAKGFAPAVPEPETYAMMLSGLGMIGFIGRRRLSKSASGLFAPGTSGMTFA